MRTLTTAIFWAATCGFAPSLLGCRRVERVELPTQAPEPKSEPEPVEPGETKLVGLELSDSGGCTLDERGAAWCWGGYATRHPGLRPSVGDDELFVATKVEFEGRIRDIAVTNHGVCWLGDGGIIRCHGAEGIEQIELGDVNSFDATSSSKGRQIVVAQLDDLMLHSNVWPGPRQYGEIVGLGLAGGQLCILDENHRITCNGVERGQDADGASSFTNSFARALAVGPWSACVIEGDGLVECVPDFARIADTSQRWIEGIDDAIAIDVGPRHGCALRASGDITCFGTNSFYQRGGEGHDAVATVKLPGPASAVAVAAGQSCALVDSQILCWGATALGPEDRRITRNDIALDSTALHVSTDFNCVSRGQATPIAGGDGAGATHVWCWGTPSVGVLGTSDGRIDVSTVPRPVVLPMPDIDDLVGQCFRAGTRTVCGTFRDRGRREGDAVVPDFVASIGVLPNRLASFTGFVERDPISSFSGVINEGWVYCATTRSGTRPRCAEYPDVDHLDLVSDAPTSGTLALGPDRMACMFDSHALTCFKVYAGYGRPAHSRTLTNIRALAANHTGWFALDNAGRVWRFTLERSEEFDLMISEPELVPLGPAEAIAAWTLEPELCALHRDGAVTCIRREGDQWGPAHRELDRGALELAAGRAHACARVDGDGDGKSESLHCWGDNRFGQLGLVGDHVAPEPTVVLRR